MTTSHNAVLPIHWSPLCEMAVEAQEGLGSQPSRILPKPPRSDVFCWSLVSYVFCWPFVPASIWPMYMLFDWPEYRFDWPSLVMTVREVNHKASADSKSSLFSQNRLEPIILCRFLMTLDPIPQSTVHEGGGILPGTFSPYGTYAHKLWTILCHHSS